MCKNNLEKWTSRFNEQQKKQYIILGNNIYFNSMQILHNYNSDTNMECVLNVYSNYVQYVHEQLIYFSIYHYSYKHMDFFTLRRKDTFLQMGRNVQVMSFSWFAMEQLWEKS